VWMAAPSASPVLSLLLVHFVLLVERTLMASCVALGPTVLPPLVPCLRAPHVLLVRMSPGVWVLGAGCWVLGAGCWVLGAGCWVLGAEWWVVSGGW
jgi:hypothetical protein